MLKTTIRIIGILGFLFATSAIADIRKEIDGNDVLYHIDIKKHEYIQVMVENTDLSLILKDLEDHRCPKNAVCYSDENNLWDGGIELKLDIIQFFDVQTIVVMYLDKPHRLPLIDHDIIITEITNENDQYHVSLKISK